MKKQSSHNPGLRLAVASSCPRTLNNSRDANAYLSADPEQVEEQAKMESNAKLQDREIENWAVEMGLHAAKEYLTGGRCEIKAKTTRFASVPEYLTAAEELVSHLGRGMKRSPSGRELASILPAHTPASCGNPFVCSSLPATEPTKRRKLGAVHKIGLHSGQLRQRECFHAGARAGPSSRTEPREQWAQPNLRSAAASRDEPANKNLLPWHMDLAAANFETRSHIQLYTKRTQPRLKTTSSSLDKLPSEAPLSKDSGIGGWMDIGLTAAAMFIERQLLVKRAVELHALAPESARRLHFAPAHSALGAGSRTAKMAAAELTRTDTAETAQGVSYAKERQVVKHTGRVHFAPVPPPLFSAHSSARLAVGSGRTQSSPSAGQRQSASAVGQRLPGTAGLQQPRCVSKSMTPSVKRSRTVSSADREMIAGQDQVQHPPPVHKVDTVDVTRTILQVGPECRADAQPGMVRRMTLRSGTAAPAATDAAQTRQEAVGQGLVRQLGREGSFAGAAPVGEVGFSGGTSHVSQASHRAVEPDQEEDPIEFSPEDMGAATRRNARPAAQPTPRRRRTVANKRPRVESASSGEGLARCHDSAEPAAQEPAPGHVSHNPPPRQPVPRQESRDDLATRQTASGWKSRDPTLWQTITCQESCDPAPRQRASRQQKRGPPHSEVLDAAAEGTDPMARVQRINSHGEGTLTASLNADQGNTGAACADALAGAAVSGTRLAATSQWEAELCCQTGSVSSAARNEIVNQQFSLLNRGGETGQAGETCLSLRTKDAAPLSAAMARKETMPLHHLGASQPAAAQPQMRNISDAFHAIEQPSHIPNAGASVHEYNRAIYGTENQRVFPAPISQKHTSADVVAGCWGEQATSAWGTMAGPSSDSMRCQGHASRNLPPARPESTLQPVFGVPRPPSMQQAPRVREAPHSFSAPRASVPETAVQSLIQPHWRAEQPNLPAHGQGSPAERSVPAAAARTPSQPHWHAEPPNLSPHVQHNAAATGPTNFSAACTSVPATAAQALPQSHWRIGPPSLSSRIQDNAADAGSAHIPLSVHLESCHLELFAPDHAAGIECASDLACILDVPAITAQNSSFASSIPILLSLVRYNVQASAPRVHLHQRQASKVALLPAQHLPVGPAFPSSSVAELPTGAGARTAPGGGPPGPVNVPSVNTVSFKEPQQGISGVALDPTTVNASNKGGPGPCASDANGPSQLDAITLSRPDAHEQFDVAFIPPPHFRHLNQPSVREVGARPGACANSAEQENSTARPASCHHFFAVDNLGQPVFAIDDGNNMDVVSNVEGELGPYAISCNPYRIDLLPESQILPFLTQPD